MKSLFGRVVHYHLDETIETPANAMRMAPAFVVNDHGDGTVNLKVFLDAGNNAWVSGVKVTKMDTGKTHTCFLPTIKK